MSSPSSNPGSSVQRSIGNIPDQSGNPVTNAIGRSRASNPVSVFKDTNPAGQLGSLRQLPTSGPFGPNGAIGLSPQTIQQIENNSDSDIVAAAAADLVKQRQAQIDLLTNNPGRNATILTPGVTNPKNGSVL